MRFLLISVVSYFLLYGCQIDLPEGQFICEDASDCPSNWFCDSDNTCYRPTLSDTHSSTDTESNTEL